MNNVEFFTTLPPTAAERLRIMASKNGFTPSEYISNAVRKILETEEDPVPMTQEEVMEEARKEFAREQPKIFSSLKACFEHLKEKNEKAALKHDRVHYFCDGAGETYSESAMLREDEDTARAEVAGDVYICNNKEEQTTLFKKLIGDKWGNEPTAEKKEQHAAQMPYKEKIKAFYTILFIPSIFLRFISQEFFQDLIH